MKRMLLAAVSVSTLFMAAPLIQLANAADMPLKAPPPAPAYSWAGFYLGIEGGGGWGSAEHTDATGFDSGSFRVSGGLIGGTVGYNWQKDRVVFGLEGDGSGAWINGSTVGTNPIAGFCGGAPPNCDSHLQALGTFRGRVGMTFDKYLPFVTGGLAIGSLHGHEGDIPANGAVGDGTTTVVGWTIGAGIEAALSPAWSVKAEYLHVDLGNHPIFGDTIPAIAGIVPQNVNFTTEILRVGVNYKLGWAPPSATK